jgi:N-formylglutamate deformylase
MTDAEFLMAFHECSLSPASFRHADHLRLAWLHVHQHTLETAVSGVCRDIQRYANHLGKPEIYHETLTIAWVRLIASHDEPTFAEFLLQNAYRLNGELLYCFWSPERLQSETARREWLAPDRMQLPPSILL